MATFGPNPFREAAELAETAYQSDLDEKKPVTVSGVKGLKNKPFKKKFRSMDHFNKWHEKDGGDHDIHHVYNEATQLTERNRVNAMKKRAAVTSLGLMSKNDGSLDRSKPAVKQQMAKAAKTGPSHATQYAIDTQRGKLRHGRQMLRHMSEAVSLDRLSDEALNMLALVINTDDLRERLDGLMYDDGSLSAVQDFLEEVADSEREHLSSTNRYDVAQFICQNWQHIDNFDLGESVELSEENPDPTSRRFKGKYSYQRTVARNQAKRGDKMGADYRRNNAVKFAKHDLEHENRVYAKLRDESVSLQEKSLLKRIKRIVQAHTPGTAAHALRFNLDKKPGAKRHSPSTVSLAMQSSSKASERGPAWTRQANHSRDVGFKRKSLKTGDYDNRAVKKVGGGRPGLDRDAKRKQMTTRHRPGDLF